jgi:Right handed beta helix region
MLSLSDHEVFLVPAQFPTIQDAIDAASRPTTIVVSPGIYSESLRAIAKPYLVIQSSKLGKRGVTIAGQGGLGVVSIERSTVHFSGIEVRSNGRLRGLLIVDSSVTFQECMVAGNRITDGAVDAFGAGMMCRGSTLRVQKSTVAGNTVDASASAGGGGLYFDDCKVEIAGSSIQANAVYATAEARGGGIWCERSTLRMWRSRVTDNALHAASCDGAGIYFRDAGDAQLGGSVVTGNGSVGGRGGGIFIDGDAARIAIHRNTVVHQNHPDDVFVKKPGD